MNIGELSRRSGVPAYNLRFYRKAGILPREKDCGGGTVLLMRRVRLLRSMGVPLEEVRKLVSGQETLISVLFRQHYDQRPGTPDWVRQAADALLEQKASFAAFDPEPFSAYLSEMPPEGRMPYASCPWRRYFARVTDNMVYGTVILLLFFLFRVWRGPWYIGLLEMVLSILLTLCLEPLFLHFCGATPGKALFGLRLRRADGGKLTVREGVARTWGMLLHGQGLYIPLYSLYRVLRCGFDCNRDGRRMEWDYDGDSTPYSYTAPLRTAVPRAAGFAACLAAFGLAAAVGAMAEYVPLYTGWVDAAQFAGNFNYYIRHDAYPDGTAVYLLDKEGNWYKAPGSGNIVVMDFSGGEDRLPPPFTYTVEDGAVTGVSFTDTREGVSYTGLNQGYIWKIALSLSGGWNPVGNVTLLDRLEKEMDAHIGEGYAFEAGNVAVSWDVSMEGLEDYSIGYFALSGREGAYTQTVTVRKIR